MRNKVVGLVIGILTMVLGWAEQAAAQSLSIQVDAAVNASISEDFDTESREGHQPYQPMQINFRLAGDFSPRLGIVMDVTALGFPDEQNSGFREDFSGTGFAGQGIAVFWLLPQVSVRAGYARHNFKNEFVALGFGQGDDMPSVINSTYSGFLGGVGVKQGFGRVTVGGSLDAMPWLTRREYYRYGSNSVDYHTPASGYSTEIAGEYRLLEHLSVTGAFRFRRTSTPFGNILFPIVPEELESHESWRSISFGVKLGI